MDGVLLFQARAQGIHLRGGQHSSRCVHGRGGRRQRRQLHRPAVGGGRAHAAPRRGDGHLEAACHVRLRQAPVQGRGGRHRCRFHRSCRRWRACRVRVLPQAQRERVPPGAVRVERRVLGRRLQLARSPSQRRAAHSHSGLVGRCGCDQLQRLRRRFVHAHQRARALRVRRRRPLRVLRRRAPRGGLRNVQGGPRAVCRAAQIGQRRAPRDQQRPVCASVQPCHWRAHGRNQPQGRHQRVAQARVAVVQL
mmetsp:Transcript_3649/g.15211  ORF Transcript_3649/g.15211 Transcript_3649/m.15211 type:complete len:250 (+) Transcript_3649:1110-1859(+)